MVNALPGTKEDFIKGYQITAPLLSDKRGVDWKEALYFEPSINIEGISAGYEEAGVKTVLPAEAHAKLEARLVPGMDPDKTLQQIKDYLADQGFGDLIVEKTLGQPGYRSDMSDPEIIKVINLAKELYPGEPVVSPTSPGTGPMAYVNNAIKAPIISLGVGYQGALDHAPNENIRLTDYEDNIKFVKLIIGSYAN